MRQQAKGVTRIPLVELFENPTERAASPKLAAYMFAGRAFLMGTGLLKEFSTKTRSWAVTTFPSLKGKYSEDAEEVIDDAAYEFFKEMRDELKREEKEGPYQAQGPYHKAIRATMKHELGPFARG
ncbi:hypothetical protein HDU76_007165 [Blyttiomyces sp. JEL0837]|nr:hypothetical protein HDU76_007165 [Blyttiomyces sp. JEL0837]